MIVRNTLNADSRKRTIEKNGKASKTIPEQAMTVKQIIDRFTKGLPVTAKNYEVQYHGTMEIPQLEKLDLAEQQQLREYAKDKVKEFNQKIADEIQAKRDKETADFNEWKAQKQQQKDQSNIQSNQGTTATQTGAAQSTTNQQ